MLVCGYISHWECGSQEIPEKYFIRINNLLGTNFSVPEEDYSNIDAIKLKRLLCFYIGLYQFTRRQCEYIIAKLIIYYCNDVLDKKEKDKYNQTINSIKKNNPFTKDSYKNCKECLSYISQCINSTFKHCKNKMGKEYYFSGISGKKLTKQCKQNELYSLLKNLNYDKYIYAPLQNIPVYNSSGIIEEYQDLPPKFKNNDYEYVYAKIDDTLIRTTDKYVDGATMLIRVGEFAFPRRRYNSTNR